MGEVSKPHSGPYLAAEGETWVLKTDYDALELSHAAAIAQRDRYRSAHARLEEQLEALRAGVEIIQQERDSLLANEKDWSDQARRYCERIVELQEQLEALRAACGGLLWLDNNIHQWATQKWLDYFKTAVTDARAALDGSNPARELAPSAPRDNETGGSLVETPDPAKRPTC